MGLLASTTAHAADPLPVVNAVRLTTIDFRPAVRILVSEDMPASRVTREGGEVVIRLPGVPEEELPTHATFENGDPIEDAWMSHVRETMWNRASFFPWQAGDLLVLDNHLMAHGRNDYAGQRRVLVALS